MKTALVTGASGFIGGHLARRLLEHGYQVRCLVRHHSSRQRLEPLGVQFVYGDVTDRESLRAAVSGVEYVFHLAGLTCALRHADFIRINTQAAGLVAAACAENVAPPVLVSVSSIAAAGPTAPGALRREQDPPAPVSQYGRSKLGGEQQVSRWAAQVPTSIVRPGIVFGPYDPGMKSVVEAICRWRLHLSPGRHSPLLSFVEVEDLCRLLIDVAERGERLPADTNGQGQGVYFAVVHQEYRTYIQLGEILASQLIPTGRVRVVRVPGPLAWCVGACNEWMSYLRGRPNLLNRDKIREGTASSWACSGEKVQRHFGFAPRQPLDVQLRAAAEWYRRAGWVP